MVKRYAHLAPGHLAEHAKVIESVSRAAQVQGTFRDTPENEKAAMGG